MKELTIDALNYLVRKVKALVAGKQDKLTFDSTPTAGSSNPVTSDGVRTAIDDAAEVMNIAVEFDETTGISSIPYSGEELFNLLNSGDRVIALSGIVLDDWEEHSDDEGNFSHLSIHYPDTSGWSTFNIADDGVLEFSAYVQHELVDNRVTELSADSTDEQYPSAKAVVEYVAENAGGGSSVDNTFIFEAVVSLSTSGLSVSLPEGVTYASLIEQINAGKTVILSAEIPAVAGILAGKYNIPFTRFDGDRIVFSTTAQKIVLYVFVDDDNSVGFNYYFIEQQSNKVTSLSASSTDTQYPSAKAVYNAFSAATEIFYVPLAFGATGFVLNGVTHADILAAYNAGKRIIGRCYVPQAAGLVSYGDFSSPMTCLMDDSTFTLAFLSAETSVEVFIASNNSVSFRIRTLQNSGNLVTSLSASSTDKQYPSAKAVYNVIGFADGEDDMYI